MKNIKKIIKITVIIVIVCLIIVCIAGFVFIQKSPDVKSEYTTIIAYDCATGDFTIKHEDGAVETIHIYNSSLKKFTLTDESTLKNDTLEIRTTQSTEWYCYGNQEIKNYIWYQLN